MELDPQRRRAIFVGLAGLAAVGIVLFSALFGLPGQLNGWWHEVLAESNQLPFNDPDTVYASALQYQHDGNGAMATAAARRALIISPGYVPAHRFLAADDLRHNDFAAAAKECRGILANDPNDGAAQLGLASAYEGMGDPGKAQGVLQNVLDNAALSAEIRRAARQRLSGQMSNRSDTPPDMPSPPPVSAPAR